MHIKKIKERAGTDAHKKLTEKIKMFNKLVNELNKKDIPDKVANSINQEVDRVNAFKGTNSELFKEVRKGQEFTLKQLEKELKLVVKNHYRNFWLAIGIGAFGVPLGTAFGLSTGNMGLLGLGLPIGLAIGVGIGTYLDNKTAKEGKQLETDIAY